MNLRLTLKSRCSSTCRRVLANGIVLLCLFAAVTGRGQALTPVLTASTNTFFSGQRGSVWLMFVNTSTTEATAAFPDKLEGRLGIEPAAPAVDLVLSEPSETRAVAIRPGQFARREYTFVVPAFVEGQRLLLVTFDRVNPLTLEVGKPVASVAAADKEDSLLLRFFKDGESEGFDPVRFFKEHISGYEPLYFIAGTETPNAKFQVSFKYQLVNNDGALGRWFPPSKGLHFAYSQTSLWDWNGESAPFFDSSYRPELLFAWDRLAGGSSNWFRLDLQGGAQHESNGKGGADSRSLNIVYLKPTLTLGKPGTIQLTLSPRIWAYVGGLEDNPDMKDYRGYADMRAVLGWSKGLQLSAVGRLGDDGDHGSLQLDLTYPMMKLLSESFSVYLHAQYFTGYGESLLLYNERGNSFRFGFSFYR